MSGNGDREKIFSNEETDDFKKIYMGVYSSNNLTRYINFHNVINERNAKYPFAIFNTDRNNKAGMHWWSFLDIYPKKLFLFNSLGFTGYKEFIIDNEI